jgi:hypothetical protein
VKVVDMVGTAVKTVVVTTAVAMAGAAMAEVVGMLAVTANWCSLVQVRGVLARGRDIHGINICVRSGVGSRHLNRILH